MQYLGLHDVANAGNPHRPDTQMAAQLERATDVVQCDLRTGHG